jgi:hypothetical protein
VNSPRLDRRIGWGRGGAVAATAVLLLAALACAPEPRSVIPDPAFVPAGRDSTAGGAPVLRIAVLPLANYTATRDGSDRVAPMILAELAAKPGVVVADAGAVQEALDREPWLLVDRVPPDLVERLAAGLHVEGLVLGSLLTYDYRDASGDRVPQVSISMRLIQCPGGKVLWSAVHSRDGDDSEWLFGFGRVRSLEQLASITVRELLGKFPAPQANKPRSSGTLGGK